MTNSDIHLSAESQAAIKAMPMLGEWAFSPNPNKLYHVDMSKLKDIASCNIPRLSHDDVVVIVGIEISTYNYYRKHKIPCYSVKVIKQLCKTKRHNLARCVVGNVPEICLLPFA